MNEEYARNLRMIFFSVAARQTNKMTCAPSLDSDQPGHPSSLIRAFACAQQEAKDPRFLHADREDSDQTGRMPRLIGVFAGRTGHFVGFVVLRLLYMFIFKVHSVPLLISDIPTTVSASVVSFLFDLILEEIIHAFRNIYDTSILGTSFFNTSY